MRAYTFLVEGSESRFCSCGSAIVLRRIRDQRCGCLVEDFDPAALATFDDAHRGHEPITQEEFLARLASTP